MSETANETLDPKVGQTPEGKVLKFEQESAINTSELKVFDFDSKSQQIEIKTPEFSAVCPFSGLPDVATVEIVYFPKAGKALELKALKYYFMSFRNVGIYQEGVTKRIFEDLTTILETTELRVQTWYNVRGGMDVTCIESGLTSEL